MKNIDDVMMKAGVFITQHDDKAGVALVESVCRSLGFTMEHRNRVLDAFYAKPRKMMFFADARRMVEVPSIRAWNRLAEKDPRFAAVQLDYTSPTHPTCLEDQVFKLVRELREKAEMDG
ncbi:MAG: hypothetical protein K9M45_11125 [Kiritimatiellales bacterium]|nr:hypothetical protein [Kiritimatiellales bacterium]